VDHFRWQFPTISSLRAHIPLNIVLSSILALNYLGICRHIL